MKQDSGGIQWDQVDDSSHSPKDRMTKNQAWDELLNFEMTLDG
ncbi:MAG: hypothetical protein Q8K42_03475 [Methylobacter sp.]|nr:hypothetical protein [Methylobacter sp.]